MGRNTVAVLLWKFSNIFEIEEFKLLRQVVVVVPLALRDVGGRFGYGYRLVLVAMWSHCCVFLHT